MHESNYQQQEVLLMSFLSDAIEKELELLGCIREKLSNDTIRPRNASIIVKQLHKNRYYYKAESVKGKTKHKYLGKADSAKLIYTVQAAYKLALREMVKHDLKLLLSFKRDYKEISENNVMDELSPCVKHVSVLNNYLPDLQKLREWAAENYEKNTAPFGYKVIRAKDGTRVRSKSECIIYNALLDAGIPFRYDPVIKFMRKNEYNEIEYISKSPDFQIMCPDGSFILIEHGGLITSSDYTKDLVSKVQLYLSNGYILGYSLFVTGDSVDGGIDSFEISRLIQMISARFSAL